MNVPSTDKMSPIDSPIIDKVFNEILPLCITPTPSESAVKKVCGMNYQEADKILSRQYKHHRRPQSAHSRAVFIAWAWIEKNTKGDHGSHERKMMIHLHNVLHGLFLFQLELDSKLVKPKS